MYFYVPLWVSLLVGVVVLLLAWNTAVSHAKRWLKEAIIPTGVVLVVLFLLGSFGYGPLYRPHPPAPRAGCGHPCLRIVR